jgi:hypothetical protein
MQPSAVSPQRLALASKRMSRSTVRCVRTLLVFGLGTAVLSVALSAQGFFARDAAMLSSTPISSPARGVTVSASWVSDDAADGFPAILHVRRGTQQFDRRFDFGLNAQVLWSPTDDRFAVTGSRDGAGGQYRSAIVEVTPSGLRWLDLTPVVEQAFGHPVACGWPESPNVAAVTWPSTQHVIVAAQIVDHSNCDSFGTFEAYRIDASSGRIEARYGQLEVKARWPGRLGELLAGARDECVETPRACEVPLNHARKP